MTRERNSSERDDTIPATDPAQPGGDTPVVDVGARYRIGEELGRGGMGRVVEAFDVQLGRTVALKEVLGSANDPIVRRFKREVQITARLEHPSIVPLYDSGTTADGRPYYVMRRVSGRPLDQLIARAVALADRLALLPNLLAAIDAIAHAHRRGVIHRDVKPANILVGDHGETVVIDWGLAKVIGEDDGGAAGAPLPGPGDSLRTQVGSVFGTPGFMAPEQARGDELDARTDVYALGATLYHLLAGHPPVSGNSATEVLESTQRAAIRPIERSCPGAPPELVAIVDKTLAYEPAARYRDAGALGEDVRRFLTGQLVAAHRYTAGERAARLVKKHRGAFAIGFIAVAALAVFGTWSLRRILVERDAATTARREAEERRRAAEDALADAHAKADELKLASARTFAETNPTKALAILKTLRPDTPKLGTALAIAKQAVVRGVPWGLPSLSGLCIQLEMSPDGALVFQMTRTGDFQVLDVRARSVALRQQLAPGAHGAWLANGQILVVTPASTPVILDARSGATTQLAMPAVAECSVSSTGEAVACVTDHGIGVVDPVARTWREVWSGSGAHDLELASDGSWIAFEQRVDAKHRMLLVIDRQGKELVRRDGEVRLLEHSAGGILAVLADDALYLVQPAAAAPAFVRVPLEAEAFRYTHGVSFVGETVNVLSGHKVWSWRGSAEGPSMLADLADLPAYGREVGDGFLLTSTTDDHLQLLAPHIEASLTMPSVPGTMVRIAARPGVRTFAATGKDVILLWDLEVVTPRALYEDGNLAFLDENRVLIHDVDPSWQWLDLRTHERTQFTVPRPIPVVRTLSDGNRLLVLGLASAGDRMAAGIVQPGQPWVDLPDIPGGAATLLDGGAAVFAGAQGKLLGKLGDGPIHELARLEGGVTAVTAVGDLELAALGRHGDLVRGRFDGPLERVHADLAPGAFITATQLDRVLIASGNRLLAWTTDVHEVFAFPARTQIEEMAVIDGGVVVMLSSSEGYFIPNGALSLPIRLPLGATNRVEITLANQLVGLGMGHSMDMIDLPSMTLWSLPPIRSATMVAYVSRRGTRVAQRGGRYIAMWTLPQPAGDPLTWLDSLTNASIDANGVLSWPWQGAPVAARP